MSHPGLLLFITMGALGHRRLPESLADGCIGEWTDPGMDAREPIWARLSAGLAAHHCSTRSCFGAVRPSRWPVQQSSDRSILARQGQLLNYGGRQLHESMNATRKARAVRSATSTSPSSPAGSDLPGWLSVVLRSSLSLIASSRTESLRPRRLAHTSILSFRCRRSRRASSRSVARIFFMCVSTDASAFSESRNFAMCLVADRSSASLSSPRSLSRCAMSSMTRK